MALSSQFSLSVELTKLLPLGPLARAAGGGLLSLLREMRDEGYDPVTEEDLAEVFGRNRIDPKFESTFRTAVRHSAVHKIADIAELMLEAGAGPTVRRSLKEPAYFSSVLQLSLLTWTHELTSLSRSLAQAFERRAKEAKDSKAPPRYDALKGTLRACREQTSGFMWELIISAVDKKLSPFNAFFDASSWYERRAVPLPVLQALLDGFTAVQHLPQATLIRIRTFTGVSTLVVWAHHVLGLTVLVQGASESIQFGEGPESVHINAIQSEEGHLVPPSASLVNETDDLLFKVEQAIEDVDLQPACRHSLAGYGLWVIEFEIQQPQVIETIVHTVVTSSLKLIEEEWQAGHQGSGDSHRGRTIYPSTKRVLGVAEIIFPGYETLLEEISSVKNMPCVMRCDWENDPLPVGFREYIEDSRNAKVQSAAVATLKKLSHSLGHVLLILSMFENTEKYPSLSLDIDVLKKDRYMPFHLPDAVGALESMTKMLEGRGVSRDSVGGRDTAAAISSWGWCICLGSLAGDDPSTLYPSLAILQGVPRREGERKRLIVDGRAKRVDYEQRKRINDSFEVAAGPGESVTLESWTRPEKTKHYIAVSDEAFEVGKVYSCRSVADPTASRDLIIGFRGMQDTYWNTIHLRACDHPVRAGQSTTLPQDCWAFRGFGRPDLLSRGPIDYTQCLSGSTHVALVAGDDSARWINLTGYRDSSGKGDGFYALFLRNADCCIQCALNYTNYFRRNRHVGLIL